MQGIAVDAHNCLITEAQRNIDLYRIHLRNEWDKVGQYLAATYLEDAVSRTSNSDKEAYE